MTDAVLIVGAGIAGLTAAQQVAGAGARAIVLERAPVVGGRLAAVMTKAQAIGNRAEGESVPLFEALAANDNVEIITNATLTAIEGRAGNFTVSILERARFVTDDCTRCKLCHGVCPVVLPNEFDAGLTFRKAIYTPMLKTLPEAWVIDIDNCLNTPPNYLPCNRCASVCEDDAIHFDQPLQRQHERHVAAVILAPGMHVQSGEEFAELGYGSHPDIVTSTEMQRLLESPGPTGGFASKPSNEEYPESVLLVLDDPSSFSLYIAASQAEQLLAQDVDKVSVLVLSPPENVAAADELTAKTGIDVSWGAAFSTSEQGNGGIAVSYEDLSAKKFVRHDFDMIVLCVDVTPQAGLQALAETSGVALGPDQYLATSGENGAAVATARPGVFVAGCGSGPKNIRHSIAEARAAAQAALAQLNPILLNSEQHETHESRQAGAASPDELRVQIEKLLTALIAR